MKISIEEHLCISSGQCVLIAPEVFDQREDDGIVVLLQETPEGGQAEQAREAVAACPVQAILLNED